MLVFQFLNLINVYLKKGKVAEMDGKATHAPWSWTIDAITVAVSGKTENHRKSGCKACDHEDLRGWGCDRQT